MKKETLSIKTIVAIGIGAAVYVVLARFASIPTPIPNTSIQTAYAFLALMAVVYGPIAGGLIGLIGHALNDAISYGSVWWSWVVVSLFVGFMIGILTRKIHVEDGEFSKKDIIQFNISQVVAQAIGWGIIAPVLDIAIYAEPANKVFTQGIAAGAANIITVAVIGTLLISGYAKTRNKSDSLSRE
ncbi:ECF-type riboflavin transporter substrate-binding protein [Jeotgalibaca caeni]|uniref:ECF-type riboflavin transporter substrate-binding protein n=1 Tax=Jeotgalibaca caeni TaxID=3028623 RepID=UPI00237E1CC7|nr:ECF-type riboflavin transporter substrate-binding protein [Jeotgalibaca caeni]MDE1549272.1 ECF-type riboflavin transporter substrate-binding protein [Jeotgalibaca caeni]